MTDDALRFIEAHKAAPFLVSVHYREPHAQWLPTRDEDWEPYQNLDPLLPEPDYPGLDVERVKRMTREYYASCASVDRNAGRMMAALDKWGLAQNTVVILTSDHGYNTGHHGIWHKGNASWMLTELPQQQWDKIPPKHRPNLFDQALRVPAVVRWPVAIRAGSVVEQTVSHLDWYPTLLAIAGVELPGDVAIRGRNFLPLLMDNSVDVALHWDNDLYCEYSMRHGATVDMRAWRTPEWKLMIDFANPGRAELYDLAHDPAEHQNLIDSAEERVQQVRRDLEAKIRAKLKEIQDPVLAEVWQQESDDDSRG